MADRCIWIANVESKRYRHARSAWADIAATRAVPELKVVPWHEVIERDGDLSGWDVFDQPAWVRFESPGKCERVRRACWAAGLRETPHAKPPERFNGPLPKGLFHCPRLEFTGFRRVLMRMQATAGPQIRFTAAPESVVRMCDKQLTFLQLSSAEIPSPPIETPSSMQECEEWLALRASDEDRGRIFAKYQYGASAVGIIVYNVAEKRIVSAESTIRIRNGLTFNTRRLVTGPAPAFRRQLQFLLQEGMILQPGIPKATVDGYEFDLRVVCLRGSVAGVVVRQSPHGITNLHLGGFRGSVEQVRRRITDRAWYDALDLCVVAARRFEADLAGVDLVFEPDGRRCWILEVNAFGGFFPGITDRSGRSFAHRELECLLDRFA